MISPKKSLGQHFLKDKNIAAKIVSSLKAEGINTVVEVGAGMGVLTEYLFKRDDFTTYAIEIDRSATDYLKTIFPGQCDRILLADFLEFDLDQTGSGPVALIGNFPYNISAPIFFKVLNQRHRVNEVVGMVQKEVAVRIAAPHGSKTYGILSVLLQAFYKIEYLFTVNETVFEPPPKVKSAVIRLTRNSTQKLPCNEDLFFMVVKTAFNQRRKTLNNSLKSLLNGIKIIDNIMLKRPEQLSVNDFIFLTNMVSNTHRASD